MSRYYNEIYFNELEKQERTGVPSAWINENRDDRDPGHGQIEQCSPLSASDDECPF